jgi:hypothetical protein
LGGADRSDPGPLGQPGYEVVDDRGEFGPVGLEYPARIADRRSQAVDLGMADSLLST